MKDYEDIVGPLRANGKPSNIGAMIGYAELLLVICTAWIVLSAFCLIDSIGKGDCFRSCLFGVSLAVGLFIALMLCHFSKWVRIQADEYERFYQEHKDEYEDDEVQPEVLQEAE